MYSTPILATRFSRQSNVVRSESPLDEDQMRRAAPSVFATGKLASVDRSVSLNRALWVLAEEIRRLKA